MKSNSLMYSPSTQTTSSRPALTTTRTTTNDAFSSSRTKNESTFTKSDVLPHQIFYSKEELEQKNKWRKSEHAVSLPMYQILNNRQTATNIFPIFGHKHGKFLNYSPIKSLKILEAANSKSQLSHRVLKRYLNDKKSFNSIKQFAVFKLNELDVATSNSSHAKLPNAIRASIICDIFESLMNSPEYSSPLIDRLKLEIYRCIYGENSEFANQNTIQSQGKDLPPKLIIPTKTFFKLKPFFKHLDILINSQQSQQRQIAHVSNVNPNNSTTESKKPNTKEARLQQKQELNKSDNAIKASKILTNTYQGPNISRFDILTSHFAAWKELMLHGNQKTNNLAKKLKVSLKKQRNKARRMNFLAWKDHIWRTKLNFYQANEFSLKRKLDESNKAAMVLLKKTAIAEQQIARVRQLRNASDMDQQQMLEKKMLQVETNFIIEKLQHSRRQLIQLQSDETLVYSNTLLTNEEKN